MSWKRYEKYQDSGVEWLGEIPEGWNVQKLKYVSTVRLSSVNKKTEDGEEPVRLCNYVDVYYNDYITPDLGFMEATASPSEMKDFTLRKGDVLITKDSEDWNDIAVPAYVRSSLPGVLCGYHLAQIRPNKKIMAGEYLFRSFYANGINDQFKVAANGITRYGIGKFWIDSSLFLVPPLSEQIAIAAFLDRETTRIDALIEKKERLIALLEEKRAGLINHAVTKGLDPSVPMKDSRVDWIGMVPAGWQISHLNHFFSLQRGYDITKDQQTEGLIPVVSSGGISSYHNIAMAKGPGVLVGRKGTVGAVYYIEDDYWAHDTTLWVNDFKGNCPKFVYYLLIILDLKRFDTGSANPTLNRNLIHPVTVAIPIPEEQNQIAIFLDNNISQNNKIIEKINRSILTLQEYRSALISAAVTGKIDLRQEAMG